MKNLTNHDLRAQWAAIVKWWGFWAANCGDFELAHKWALKQFVRLVPHGKYLQTHLAHRHLGQFAFEAPIGAEAEAAAAQPAPEPLRFCHCEACKAAPGHHQIHVHVVMPGLQEEDAEGLLHEVHRARERTVLELEVDDMFPEFQRALRRLMAEAQGVRMRNAVMPDTVCQATRMKLLWHDASGKVQYQDTFHCAEDYHGGPWHDALMAKHAAVAEGPARCALRVAGICQAYHRHISRIMQYAAHDRQHMIWRYVPPRRLAKEYSYRERQEKRAGLADGQVLDVAGIDGIYFCTIPECAAARGGEVLPFFLVRWMHHIDFTEQMQVAWARPG